MEARFYNSKEINIEQVAVDLVRAYQAMGYQAQNIGNYEQMIVQLKKGSELEALIGMQAALSTSLKSCLTRLSMSSTFSDSIHIA